MGDTEVRKKAVNFSAADRALLLKLSNEMKNIIESKKTDAITWKQKEEGWKKLANKFNASTNGTQRTDKQLKNKYESIKKELRKQHSQYSAYLRGTGGGPYVEPPPARLPEEKILASNIALTIEGLSSEFDSDACAGVSGIPVDNIEIVQVEENESIRVDWNDPNSGLLQTKKDKRLQVKHIDSEETIRSTSNIPEDTDHNYTNASKPQGSNWQSRRRPILPKKRCATSASAKFENLAEKKMKLVDSQQKLVEERLLQQKIEHEKNSLLLDLQIEEGKLKNKKLICECVHI